MANLEMKMNVSVESVLHDGLKDVLQSIFDKYGITVENIDATWVRDILGKATVYDTQIRSTKR
jgi:hypothetical protein